MMSGERPECDARMCNQNQRSTGCQFTNEFILDCSRPQSTSSVVAPDTPIQSPTNFAEMTQVPMQPLWPQYQPLTPEITPKNQMAHFSLPVPHHLMPSKQAAAPKAAGRPRGPKFVWTREQKLLLEEYYKLNPFSNPSVVEIFIQKWEIPPQKVKCWFQNRRSKDRKKMKDEQAAAAAAAQARDGSTPPAIVSSTDNAPKKKRPAARMKLPPQYPYFPNTGFMPGYDQSYLHSIGTQNPVQFSVAPYYSNYPALMSRISNRFCAPTYSDKLYPYQPAVNMPKGPIYSKEKNYAEKTQNYQFGGMESSKNYFVPPTSYSQSVGIPKVATSYSPKAMATYTASVGGMMTPMNLPFMTQMDQTNAKTAYSSAPAQRGYQAPVFRSNHKFFRPLYDQNYTYPDVYGRSINQEQSKSDGVDQSGIEPVSPQSDISESAPSKSDGDDCPPEETVLPENLSVRPENPASIASSSSPSSPAVDTSASASSDFLVANDSPALTPPFTQKSLGSSSANGSSTLVSSVASSSSGPSTVASTGSSTAIISSEFSEAIVVTAATACPATTESGKVLLGSSVGSTCSLPFKEDKFSQGASNAYKDLSLSSYDKESHPIAWKNADPNDFDDSTSSAYNDSDSISYKTSDSNTYKEALPNANRDDTMESGLFSTSSYFPYNSMYMGLPTNPVPAHTKSWMPSDARNAGWSESTPMDENNNILVGNYEKQIDGARRLQMMSELMLQMQQKHMMLLPKDEFSPSNDGERPPSCETSLDGECSEVTYSDIEQN
ncbi:uncharacterized protein LOC135484736 [Lineus longissimus]|uniref:uncharacterized protein LOC135484736 n=1 Tax=Lineus longissimus TaxID=88925 RepID=UPI002B4E47A7